MDSPLPDDIIETIDEMLLQQSPLYRGEPIQLCGHCNAVFGEIDMISHIHFFHQLRESASCPCNDCKMATLATSSHAVDNATVSAWERMILTPASSDRVDGGSVECLSQQRTSPRSETETLPDLQQPWMYPDLTPEVMQQHVQDEPIDAGFGGLAQMTLPTFALPANPLDMTRSPPSWTESANSRSAVSNAKPSQTTRITPASLASGTSTPQPPMPMQHPKPVVTRSSQVATPDPFQRPKIFVQADRPICENNLPYEMSLIEMGNFRRNVNGDVKWSFIANPAPALRNNRDELVRSVTTEKDMRALPMLPDKIERSFEPWLLVLWTRLGAAEHLDVRFQDIFDRMDTVMTHSALSNRMQKWCAGTGTLPLNICTNFDWPSKQTVECLRDITFLQAKFNTWWDVEHLHAEDVYIVRQPSTHPGYRNTNPDEASAETPWYIIDNPDKREMSERAKMIADAMLFLEIKAEEGDVHFGVEGMLSWIAKTPLDGFTEHLDRDILLEFKRWREGCPDTPSIADLRTALDQASSQAEVNAIAAGDFSLTPALQAIVAGLGNAREARRGMDAGVRAEASRKSALRIERRNGKRKADTIEEGAIAEYEISKRQKIMGSKRG